MMLRWRKTAHVIGPHKRQLMRDDQSNGIRKLKRGQSEKKEINIKICKRTSGKIYV